MDIDREELYIISIMTIISILWMIVIHAFGDWINALSTFHAFSIYSLGYFLLFTTISMGLKFWDSHDIDIFNSIRYGFGLFLIYMGIDAVFTPPYALTSSGFAQQAYLSKASIDFFLATTYNSIFPSLIDKIISISWASVGGILAFGIGLVLFYINYINGSERKYLSMGLLSVILGVVLFLLPMNSIFEISVLQLMVYPFSFLILILIGALILDVKEFVGGIHG